MSRYSSEKDESGKVGQKGEGSAELGFVWLGKCKNVSVITEGEGKDAVGGTGGASFQPSPPLSFTILCRAGWRKPLGLAAASLASATRWQRSTICCKIPQR